jgi:hypothetical protein
MVTPALASELQEDTVPLGQYLQTHFASSWTDVAPTLVGVDLTQSVNPTAVGDWVDAEPRIRAAISLSEPQLDQYRLLAASWDDKPTGTVAPLESLAINPNSKVLSSDEINGLMEATQPFTSRLEELGFLEGTLLQGILLDLWENKQYQAVPFVIPIPRNEGSKVLLTYIVSTAGYNVLFAIRASAFPDFSLMLDQIRELKVQRASAAREFIERVESVHAASK